MSLRNYFSELKERIVGILRYRKVDRKLQMRLRMYLLILLVMFFVIIFDIYQEYIGVWGVLAGVGVGSVVGVIVSRMHHYSWDESAQRVVGNIDRLGALILLVYMLFSFLRSRVISSLVHGPTVGAMSFSIVVGVTMGRVLGIRGRVIQVLQHNEVLRFGK